MTMKRLDFDDGEPPAYVYSSPCCHRSAVLPAWIIRYAHRHTEGRLLIECGRYSTDPLRAAGVVPAQGCGIRYVVVCSAADVPR